MPSYTQINEKLLEVKLSNDVVYSKKGAMIGYTGQITFARSFLGGGGVQDLAMRAVTNEQVVLMSASGSGSVLYGHMGMHVQVITLRGGTLYVESESVLAFDHRLRAGTMFLGNQGGVQGIVRGMVSGQGLFTTTLQGNGELAIVSKGNAIELAVSSEKPLFVDPNAYLCHTGQLSSQIVTDVNWKTLIGQASGESYQVKFTGEGSVYIQASER